MAKWLLLQVGCIECGAGRYSDSPLVEVLYCFQYHDAALSALKKASSTGKLIDWEHGLGYQIIEVPDVSDE